MKFSRKRKTQLSDSQVKEMDDCYDVFSRCSIIHSKNIKELETKLKRTSRLSSMCELEFKLDLEKTMLKTYENILSFIDDKLETEKDLQCILDFFEWGGFKDEL